MNQTDIVINTIISAKPQADAQKYANEMAAKGYRVHPPSIAFDKMFRTHLTIMCDKID